MTNENILSDENVTAPAETTPQAPTVGLMQPVVYISGKGKAKAALVIGTKDTVQPGTSLGYTLDAGEVTIQVFSPSGLQETKKKVAYSDDPEATRVWHLV